ncbi:hypothetical protein P872_08145 [Rhodonellum psychrophilum GCM71 = DSM 17998]|uniref:Uncharacterized protein n=1 Tax=Rhodonellum psychrophilum GCM71 = DSM 17998 TaxID=1123057 RepID=U5BZM5_9BACT|nr:hypothetical protein P872_08145 [Rhodonellum psychrophilum GCM71 = DSM 17998]
MHDPQYIAGYPTLVDIVFQHPFGLGLLQFWKEEELVCAITKLSKCIKGSSKLTFTLKNNAIKNTPIATTFAILFTFVFIFIKFNLNFF